MLTLGVDSQTLVALIEATVASTVAKLQSEQLPENRLAWSEPEGARLLGLEVHQLRDERLRGRIGSTKIVGGRVRYTNEDLREYLERHRQPRNPMA